MLMTGALVNVALAGSANAGLLYGSSNYYNPSASSVFGSGWGPSNLFDNDLSTQWAISGSAGGNPQGQDVGWFAFTLRQQAYTIDAIRLATRNASGQVNGIDTINVWMSTTSFDVNLVSTASTDDFLGRGLSPTWTMSNFASASAESYTLGTPVMARYFLVQVINTSDNLADRNLGLAEFTVSVATVPAPGALALLGAAGLVGARRRRG
jgi:MYXO-CTERM domain-containing protein